jgi:lipoate-protein ligase A
MDLGNYNYSVVARDQAITEMTTVPHVFNFICSAIVRLLSQLGCKSRFVHPSSVFVENRKISGSAQYLLYEGFLHHGTLLVNADLEVLQAVLNSDPTLAGGLGAVPSNPSPVVNLSHLLKREFHSTEITDLLVEAIMKLFGENCWTFGSLSKDEYGTAHLLLNTKYSDSHWLLGTSM